VVKPDRAADQLNTRKSEEARRAATAYFVAAERFLTADRGITKDEAILIYDARTGEADRLKAVDAAIAAAQPCGAVYEACRTSHPKICTEQPVLTN
jgi:hypothetical protein